MKRIQCDTWQRAIVTIGLVFGMATSPVPEVNEASREVYWFFSLNDAAEVQFHGSALREPVTPGVFIQALPSDSGGTLYLIVESSTGWFLDALGPDDAVASSGVSVSSERAGDAAGVAPVEDTKTGTADLMRLWAHDDDFNDIASWTFQSVELVGRSVGDMYVVRVNYPSVEVNSVN